MKIPVLLITFNRLETALITFDAIRTYKPDRLYIAADGWRTEGEKIICEKTRQTILNLIDWSCNVQTLFQNTNLGCGLGCVAAINWFFKHEEYGIILEDDNVPSADAFAFCEELLPKYKDCDAVKMINLTTDSKFNINTSYTFVKYPEISGWASWQRAWDDFDFNFDISAFITSAQHYTYFPFYEAWIRSVLWKYVWRNDIKKYNKLTFWDYQWSLSIFSRRGLCIQPTVNTITNIGYGTGSHCPDASHPQANLPPQKMQFPLIHPQVITLNKKADKKMFARWI